VQRIILLLLILVGLLQYRLWFGDGNVLELRRMKDRIVELEQDGERRRLRNTALDAEVTDLKQGTEAIEESARQNLGMIKEGEDFVQLVEDRPDVKEAPETPPPPANRPAGPAKPRHKPAPPRPPR
jgi:cell division protein FtsB